MSDTLYFDKGPALDAARHLIDNSALDHCTESVIGPSPSMVTVKKRWPGLSTGEAILWHPLASIAGGDLYDASARLDDRSKSAAVGAVTRLMGDAA